MSRKTVGACGPDCDPQRENASLVGQAVVESFATSPPLIAAGARLLIACSGGADSVALLAATAQVMRDRPDLELRVAAGHVDHGLRGSSADEAAQVRAVAERLGVPAFVCRVSDLTDEIAVHGLEAAARTARYAALAGLAAEAGADVVLTGHTRRDQAETLLLRLARGAGPGSMAGVRERRALTPSISLVRPLLAVPRASTEALCAQLGLPVLSDPHNDDQARSRTKVRSAFAELSRLLNPRLEEALAGAAALFAAEDDLLGQLAAEGLAKAEAGQDSYRADGLAALHPALQRRALLLAASLAGGRPERAHLETLMILVRRKRQDGPSGLDLPGARVSVARGVLHFRRPLPRTTPASPGASEVAERSPSS